MQFLTSGFYVNPGSVLAIGVIFPVLGILAVGGRFIARLRYGLGMKTDDWLCIPALLCVIGTGIVYIYGGAKKIIGIRLSPEDSLGELLKDPSYHQNRLLELEYASNVLCGVAAGFIRLSFLFFYRRIFRGRSFEIVSWTMIAIVSAWFLSIFITFFAVCNNHLPAVWQGNVIQLEYCPNMLHFLGGLSITGFILDLFILAIPFPWIWRLNMPVSQKLAVSSVFLCGLFTVAASAAKMVVGIDAMTYKTGQYMNVMGLKSTDDLLGDTAVWLFWSYIETGTGMVVCCLPSLKPFFNAKSARKWYNSVQSWPGVSSIFSKSKSRSSDASSDREFAIDKEKNAAAAADDNAGAGAAHDHTRSRNSDITVTNTVHLYTEPV